MSFLTPTQKTSVDALSSAIAKAGNVDPLVLTELGIQRDIQNLVNMRLARDDPALFLKQLDQKDNEIIALGANKAAEIYKKAQKSGFDKEEAKVIARQVFDLQKSIDEITKDISIGRASRDLAMARSKQVLLPPAEVFGIDEESRKELSQSAIAKQAS